MMVQRQVLAATAEPILAVHRLSGAMGAEIRGVDLTQSLSEGTFAAIYQAFLDHQMIFFRAQTLTPAQQRAFGARFGKPLRYPFVAGLPDAPEIFEILKEAEAKENFGGFWHSDSSYQARPPKATMLYCHEAPPVGGDTLFASGYRAYDALSAPMQSMLQGLIGVNNANLNNVGGRAAQFAKFAAMKTQNETAGADFEARHPIVRTHGETGRKALYLNRAHTAAIEGMYQYESDCLIQFLCDHATKAAFTCRLHWQPGTLAIWDNRCCLHYALNDYFGHRRRMHRLIIEGEEPF